MLADGVLARNPGDPAALVEREQVVVPRDVYRAPGVEFDPVDALPWVRNVVGHPVGAHAEGTGVERNRACGALLFDNLPDIVEPEPLRRRPQEHRLVTGERGVHHDRETAERGAALDVGDEIRRDVDPLDRGAEHEVAGVDHEVLVLGDDRLADVVLHLLGAVGVDAGDVRPLELQELTPQTEVDARGLYL